MSSDYKDTTTDLVINRMHLSTYNELLSDEQIYSDELYLIDDPDFDVCSKRIINVNDPISATDAVNLDYLDSNYINQHNLTAYVDKSKLYSSNLSAGWENGSTCIKGDLGVYVKDTSTWETAVVKGSVDPEDVTVVWTTGYGWRFDINGYQFGQNFMTYADTLKETTTYDGEEITVSATSWHLSTHLLTQADLNNENSEFRQTLSSVFRSVVQSMVKSDSLN